MAKVARKTIPVTREKIAKAAAALCGIPPGDDEAGDRQAAETDARRRQNAAGRARRQGRGRRGCRPGSRAPGRPETRRPQPGWRRRHRSVEVPTAHRPRGVNARRSPTANAITISPVSDEVDDLDPPRTAVGQQAPLVAGEVETLPGECLGERHDQIERAGDDAVAEQRFRDAVGGRALGRGSLGLKRSSGQWLVVRAAR